MCVGLVPPLCGCALPLWELRVQAVLVELHLAGPGQPPHHRHELDRCSTTGVRWSPVSTPDGTTVHAQAIQLDRWLLPPPLDGVGFSSAMEREQHPVGSSWIGDAASSWIGGSFYQLHMESGLHLRIFLLKRIVFRLLYKWLVVSSKGLIGHEENIDGVKTKTKANPLSKGRVVDFKLGLVGLAERREAKYLVWKVDLGSNDLNGGVVVSSYVWKDGKESYNLTKLGEDRVMMENNHIKEVYLMVGGSNGGALGHCVGKRGEFFVKGILGRKDNDKGERLESSDYNDSFDNTKMDNLKLRKASGCEGETDKREERV
ncbi:hypothetical protein LWI29_005690 [Acer saccharum]|uniref:Uncharacterized protein n=1 Tax=Acer saccharum TaxID=4024 RepID=A0AA39VN56_ACESA|nr:hypothetical protein LWI29_005690 [Acer saccharum]